MQSTTSAVIDAGESASLTFSTDDAVNSPIIITVSSNNDNISYPDGQSCQISSTSSSCSVAVNAAQGSDYEESGTFSFTASSGSLLPSSLAFTLISKPLVVASGVGGGSVFQSTDTNTWTTTATGRQLDSLAASGSEVVAVGWFGVIDHYDGTEWEKDVSGTVQDLNGVAYDSNEGYYITVGGSSTILRSSDGVAWSAMTSGTTNALYGIAYDSTTDQDVVVGQNRTILASTDGGENWTALADNESNIDLHSVIYANSQYIAVGYDYINGESIILSSTDDGDTWNSADIVTDNTQSLWSVAYNGSDQYVAVGNSGTILTSSDGTSWSAATGSGIVSGTIWSVTYDSVNSRYVAATISGEILTSTDGETWTSDNNKVTTLPLYGAFYDSENGKTYVVGDEDIIISAGSDDPDNFIIEQAANGMGLGDTFNAVAYGNAGQYVLVDALNGNIIVSDDWGLSWALATGNDNSNGLLAIVYDGSNEQYLTVGSDGTVLTSSDAENWTAQTSGVTENLNGVAYDSANNRYIAVGNADTDNETDTIITSVDGGASWAARTDTDNAIEDLNGVTYDSDSDQYVAVGDGGIILLSVDGGVSWQSQNSPTTEDLNAVLYDSSDKQYIAVGDDDTDSSIILTSSDGTSWTQRASYLSDRNTVISFYGVN